MLFKEEGIQSVDGKDGIIMGRQQIKDTEIYADGNKLNANVMGYRYLGNNIAIAYGNWSSTSDDNAKVTGQWGNLFKIEGDEALLIMESAGMIQ